MRPNWPRLLLVLGTLAVVIGVVWAGSTIWSSTSRTPAPIEDQCRAEADGAGVNLTLEQARNATVIASVGLTRGLPERAVAIALATAYQESGIRNLDYGHADSVGLFQQRPSKGWGSVKQIMDPYYSSAKFYEALVRVRNWRTGDMNDIAQAVQRSAHPEAYRKHVSKARVLAAVFTGTAPGGFTCKVGKPGEADTDGLARLLRVSFGEQAEVGGGSGLTVRAASEELAWSAATLTIAHTGQYGVARVSVGGAEWEHDTRALGAWRGNGGGRVAGIAFR